MVWGDASRGTRRRGDQDAATDASRTPTQIHRIGENTRLRSAYVRFVKPAIDRTGAFALTVLTLPVVAAVVVAIWATMGRPAFFLQNRVGRDGRVFTVYKFRTMMPDRRARQLPFAGSDRRLNHKSEDDPRHTSVGRFLRKWSLDEIPQFWNVLRGDMSLVGPRPEMVDIVRRYEPWQHARHAVKPGVTGLWQISERGDRPMHQATDVDLAYVERISLATDLKILVMTVPAALGRQTGL